MPSKIFRLLQANILIALSLFLLQATLRGQLGLYIHQRFQFLTYLAIAGLFLIGLVALFASFHRPSSPGHYHNPSAFELALLSLPVLIGLLIPVKPLGAAAIESKGINTALGNQPGETIAFEPAADERNILDWNRIFNSEQDLSPYLGENAKVTGFIYHDPRLPKGQFLVSRFILVCCAADAFAIGMVVSWPDAADLVQDAWVKVSGPVQTTEIDGQRLPLIQAEKVEGVEKPDNFYLYP
jgi:uncharacterized repeat protein (TIGR03943 family)